MGTGRDDLPAETPYPQRCPPTKDGGQLILHGKKGQPRLVAWLEFHQHVHIACGGKVMPEAF